MPRCHASMRHASMPPRCLDAASMPRCRLDASRCGPMLRRHQGSLDASMVDACVYIGIRRASARDPPATNNARGPTWPPEHRTHAHINRGQFRLESCSSGTQAFQQRKISMRAKHASGSTRLIVSASRSPRGLAPKRVHFWGSFSPGSEMGPLFGTHVRTRWCHFWLICRSLSALWECWGPTF